jgi:NAD(P)-dependent dehydrogenase (short-subunit alcohol dehydrogenase family)
VRSAVLTIISDRQLKEGEDSMGVLDGRVCVVVGGTSGIGAEIGRAFDSEGASVVIAGRRETEGEQLAADLGPNALFVRSDVTAEADVAALMAATVERFGRLDCLVNSAGAAASVAGIVEVDLGRLAQTLSVHVGGTVAAMKHAAPIMVSQGSGSIVSLASIGGRVGGWTSLDYSAAKAAILQLSRSVAVELAEHGVRVNSISPGPILTGIFAKGAGIAHQHADRTAGSLEPVFRDRLELWQPIPRVGLPRDVAPVAVWLASDASAFVTGQDFPVDGGITAGRPAAVSAADRAAMAKVLLPART